MARYVCYQTTQNCDIFLFFFCVFVLQCVKDIFIVFHILYTGDKSSGQERMKGGEIARAIRDEREAGATVHVLCKFPVDFVEQLYTALAFIFCHIFFSPKRPFS